MAVPVCRIVSLLSFSLSLAISAAISPVKVGVYYESLCPDSESFFQSQLLPAFKKIGSYMIVDLIPYGNAHYKGKEGEYTFTCQHGPAECYGNIAQTCFIATVNDTQKRLDFINCSFSATPITKSVDMCIRNKHLQEKIKKCVNSAWGKNMQYAMAKKTDSLYPPQTWIPWITINGKGNASIDDQATKNLMSVICQEFMDEKPDSCPKATASSKHKYRYRSYYL